MSWAPPVRAFQKLVEMTTQDVERQLHGAILIARRHGNLDLANKLSEFQHWTARKYNTDMLPQLFKGLPPFPKAT